MLRRIPFPKIGSDSDPLLGRPYVPSAEKTPPPASCKVSQTLRPRNPENLKVRKESPSLKAFPPWGGVQKLQILGSEFSARSFSDRSFFMDVRVRCPFRNAFFQHLEGLTEVFGGMSAGMSGPKLPLWAEFLFLKYPDPPILAVWGLLAFFVAPISLVLATGERDPCWFLEPFLEWNPSSKTPFKNPS